ncbi:hypothetical protein QBC46DRAFT_74464 [Diplogelasinospora grovesii]|uniref:Erythromycin esterase n=1 Tax=Diplogelasinospora grovesii TaxID=303347 RepID=A0AAN6NDT1_9PEZI|nr:hypothetical protein QBC46DRAFT_74464 [Diplogelasinospora grovesii]
MARRSARLASASKASKPTQIPSLSAVAERDESPADGAAQSLAAVMSSPMVPKTPGGTSPVRPPLSEMHPSKVHHTMAAPSSGLRLGFTDIKPTNGRGDHLPAVVQTTPSKIGIPTSPFTFRFNRHTSDDSSLGPEAQRLMDEIREDAARIKAQLMAQRDAEREKEQLNSRKIASAKGKAGRFSAAHMAEFKKMDSIENHPSAFRAQAGRTTPLKATPLKAGVKRSQSKANLDEPESVRAKKPAPASTTTMKAKAGTSDEQPLSPVKRARQHIDDDASSSRPVSRDGSTIPRPKSAGQGSSIPRSKSNLASLMTPTKSYLALTTSVKTPVHNSLARSPLKSTLGGLPRSATTGNLHTLSRIESPEKEAEPAHVEVKSPTSRLIKSPTSRLGLDRVKSILRGNVSSAAKTKSALPLPSALSSKTPGPTRLDKELPPVPFTTPGRKLTKRVAFTPETQRAALSQNSPSPIKSSIPLSKSRPAPGEVYYPNLDSILAAENTEDSDDASYPDLLKERPLPEPPIKAPSKLKGEAVKPAPKPGTFTFRSDHTISFGSVSPSFGTSPGQASVRQVRPSILPTEKMPGSFPDSVLGTTSPMNKENQAPRSTPFLALPHGMRNKKRNRVSTDEEEEEERAAKKRKQEPVPEGDALLAPRLVAAASGSLNKQPQLSSPSSKKLRSSGLSAGVGTPTPKKKSALSLSRLNMLARPKLRK